MEATILPALDIGSMGMVNAVKPSLVNQFKSPTSTPNNNAALKHYYTSVPTTLDQALVSFFKKRWAY